MLISKKVVQLILLFELDIMLRFYKDLNKYLTFELDIAVTWKLLQNINHSYSITVKIAIPK